MHGMLFDFEGRLFRAFKGPDAERFRALLASPWLHELFDAGLVRFRKASISLEGHDLVVEVDRVRVVSYPLEWPTVMLREAGIMVTRLAGALARRGLALHDAHPWNVLFDTTRPVWVDLGSIVDGRSVPRAWAWEYRRHFVLPLSAHRMGLHRLGDALQREQEVGWKSRLDTRATRLLPLGYRMLTRSLHEPVRFFESLGDYVTAMPDRGAASTWSDYRQGHGVDVVDRDRFNQKERAVDGLLSDTADGTVIDIGANAGWFSRLAAAHGNEVIAVDTDDPTLGALYLEARRAKLPILPLRLNVMWPTGSHGMGLAYTAAPDRLRADTALALAVLHHIVGRQGVSFSAFAKAMDRFARRDVIVEFVPRTDLHVARWPIASELWYEPAAFIAAMAPYFSHVRTVPSSPDPRVIMHFRRAGA